MPATARVERVDRLHGALAAGMASGGGWPYYEGKVARIEPTCWALLALSARTGRGQPSIEVPPHFAFLAARQRPDGLLVDHERQPPNFTANALAACVLGARGVRSSAAVGRPSLDRLIGALLQARGLTGADSPGSTQDNSLRGWPWIPDTFSWVEPTALGVLALKKLGSARSAEAATRIDEATRLLVNRSCEGGGWNFGNASLFNQDLRPYVPTTALALLALQDRREHPVVALGLAFLESAWRRESSAMALALTAICLRAFARPSADVESRLAADLDSAIELGNLHGLAMALYALTADDHGVGAFRAQA